MPTRYKWKIPLFGYVGQEMLDPGPCSIKSMGFAVVRVLKTLQVIAKIWVTDTIVPEDFLELPRCCLGIENLRFFRHTRFPAGLTGFG